MKKHKKNLFPLINHCRSAFDIWQVLNEKFDNFENIVEIKYYEVYYHEMNRNLQDYKFVNYEFLGKEDEPLSFEFFCV